MHAIEQARRAYAPASTPLRSARSTEVSLFAEVIARLKAASDMPADDPRGFPALAAALHDNRMLWTTLAGDVADDGNGLPQTLRAQLFYLAQFTEAHSRSVLRGTAAVGPLIDINTAVMRGLGPARPAAEVN